MKGILLAGGIGSRLYPVSLGVSKQLLPVYDKPMIFYSMSILMLAKISEILIITKPSDALSYRRLFGSGKALGVKFTYKIQKNPIGIPDAFAIGKDFIGDDDVCLVLGDNIFYGDDLVGLLEQARFDVETKKTAVVFGYTVCDPQRYGIIELAGDGRVTSIEEKPSAPKSNLAVVGLYFYPNDVVNKLSILKPSERGELEISDVNSMFLKEDRLKAVIMGRGYAWFDAGTHESLMEASQFIYAVEHRQGMKVACLEEISFANGWISLLDLQNMSENMVGNSYGEYVKQMYLQASKRLRI